MLTVVAVDGQATAAAALVHRHVSGNGLTAAAIRVEAAETTAGTRLAETPYAVNVIPAVAEVFMYRFVMLFGLVCAASPAVAQSTASITISGKHLASGETRTIEVFDENCNQSRGSYSVRGGGTASVGGMCVNSSGYINARYRNVSNNGPWIGWKLRKPGDAINF